MYSAHWSVRRRLARGACLIAVVVAIPSGCGDGDPSYGEVARCQGEVSGAGFEPMTRGYQRAYDRCIDVHRTQR